MCKNKRVSEKGAKASDESCIIRLYGGKFIQMDNKLRLNGLEGEVLTFYLLGERSIGPKLYGVFDGGRLEEYLPTYTTLTDDDIADAEAMGALARKYARMHNLSVPLNKEPRDYFGFIEKALKEKLPSYRALLDKLRPDPSCTSEEERTLLEAYNTFNSFDFDAFIDQLKSLVKRVKSKVVLAHNDTNRANAMIDRSAQAITVDCVRILDFEFSGYNYRGSDIGSHFQNRRIDVAQFLQGKFEKKIPYPDRQSREHFIRQYLDESRAIGVELHATTDTVQHILLEGELYGNLQHLYMFAYIVADHERWKDVEIRAFNPVFMLMSDMKDFMDRKEETLKMLHELSL